MNYKFRKPRKLEIEIRKPSQKHTNLSPKYFVLAAFFSLATNAALSGEQRQPPYLTHCTLNT
ncbi:hypothetical protein FORC17_1405 [Vibrio vulnificus]|nr:hypothetical protein FORC17_1405 [Vibrio vulnificus]HAS8236991.1 hypothetical protein [Vibrio vulnificus]